MQGRTNTEWVTLAILQENVRMDGRALEAYRHPLHVDFLAQHGEVEVGIGATRALGVCHGEVIVPPPERPNEGRLQFGVDFSACACAETPGASNADARRVNALERNVGNFIDRMIKNSHVVDVQALCIVAGQHAWSLRVDVRILNDDGNVGDVCGLAALCALLSYRKAEVEVVNGLPVVRSVEERVPAPLILHHFPVPVTFAILDTPQGTPLAVLDPTLEEESMVAGTLSIAVSLDGSVHGSLKTGGGPIDQAFFDRAKELAHRCAKQFHEHILSKFNAHKDMLQRMRRNVHRRYGQKDILDVSWDVKEGTKAWVPVKAIPEVPARTTLPSAPTRATGVNGPSAALAGTKTPAGASQTSSANILTEETLQGPGEKVERPRKKKSKKKQVAEENLQMLDGNVEGPSKNKKMKKKAGQAAGSSQKMASAYAVEELQALCTSRDEAIEEAWNCKVLAKLQKMLEAEGLAPAEIERRCRDKEAALEQERKLAAGQAASASSSLKKDVDYFRKEMQVQLTIEKIKEMLLAQGVTQEMLLAKGLTDEVIERRYCAKAASLEGGAVDAQAEARSKLTVNKAADASRAAGVQSQPSATAGVAPSQDVAAPDGVNSQQGAVAEEAHVRSKRKKRKSGQNVTDGEEVQPQPKRKKKKPRPVTAVVEVQPEPKGKKRKVRRECPDVT